MSSHLGRSNGSRRGHGRAQTMTAIVIPPLGSSTSTVEMPVLVSGPPVKFDHTADYSGFVNHSNHRIYKNKMHPTGLHFLEAMKYTHQPALQERIWTCKDVNEMYPLSEFSRKCAAGLGSCVFEDGMSFRLRLGICRLKLSARWMDFARAVPQI